MKFKEMLDDRIDKIKSLILDADFRYKIYEETKTELNKQRLIDSIESFYFNKPSWEDCKGHEQGGETRYQGLENCYYLSPVKSYLCRRAIKKLNKELKNDKENPVDVDKLINIYREHYRQKNAESGRQAN